MSGTPAAIASHATRPNPSCQEGISATLDPLSSSIVAVDPRCMEEHGYSQLPSRTRQRTSVVWFPDYEYRQTPNPIFDFRSRHRAVAVSVAVLAAPAHLHCGPLTQPRRMPPHPSDLV